MRCYPHFCFIALMAGTIILQESILSTKIFAKWWKQKVFWRVIVMFRLFPFNLNFYYWVPAISKTRPFHNTKFILLSLWQNFFFFAQIVLEPVEVIYLIKSSFHFVWKDIDLLFFFCPNDLFFGPIWVVLWRVFSVTEA